MRDSTPAAGVTTPSPASGGVQTVRRVITYLLLLVMVVIAAIGLRGLLERALDAADLIAANDTVGLAQSLAFSLIAGPLAALLWWLNWREATIARDRASIMWPVYLILASTVSLLVFTFSLLSWGSDLVGGRFATSGLATAIVWGLVWLWHYWMWRHPAKGPTRLRGVAPALASFLGLWIGVAGLVNALAWLIDSAADSLGSTVVIGGPVWQPVVQQLVWAVGGTLLWWWHWFRAGVREQRTGFSTVVLVLITGFGGFGLFVYGAVLTLYTVLSLLLAPAASLGDTLDALGIGVAGAAFGALVMVYHGAVVARHADAVRAATALVTSGVALATAATGIGVTVNALLGALGTQLVGDDFRRLLVGGLSALLVGGALWWAAWRPLTASEPERAATPGRRAYLVVIFGLSALVALITLLVIGYQIFAFALHSGGEGLLDRVRQAFGLLVATLLVAAYHFALWQGDRRAELARRSAGTEEGAAGAVQRTLRHLTLVTAAAPESLVAALTAATGARVTVLPRAGALEIPPDAAALLEALASASTSRVLLLADGTPQVIELAD